REARSGLVDRSPAWQQDEADASGRVGGFFSVCSLVAVTVKLYRLILGLLLLVPAGTASADLLTELARTRNWIGYSPRNYNPNIGQQPSQTSIRNDLQQLYDAGWRNLYNYTLDGTQRHVPRIAKEIGFENVLAGVFYFDEAQLNREKSAALAEDEHIDGYLVGNEGLAFGRYNGEQLLAAVDFFDDFGKPVTTTEVGGLYLQVPELLDVGDFASINIQPWFNASLDPTDPAELARAVRDEYVAIKALRPDRLVVIKEAWWPTDARPYSSITPPPGAASEANQVAFFEALANEVDAAGDPILFQWGESHDQPWKNNEQSPFGLIGPDWGFYTSGGQEKAIVDALDDVYTGSVPVNFLIGDYNRDGVVDSADEAIWQADYGSVREIAGSGADGTLDRPVNAADYAAWRDARDAASTASATPEPGSALLLLLAFSSSLAGWRR
ncbi:MAG: hypothetical protein AAF266_04295, partial [Planctomycetota bacterium]